MRSRLAVLAIGAMLSAVVPASGFAQSDEQAIVAVVTRFFDGMRARDSAMIRSTVVPSTVLEQASGPTGLSEPRSINWFIERVSAGTGPGGNELIQDPKIHIDGPMASLWAYFTYSRGGQTAIDHCGVDSFLLRKGPDGWKIFHIADTHRTEGCTPIGKG